jgi:hypothetical protein
MSVPAWAIIRRGPAGPVTYLDMPPAVLRAVAAAAKPLGDGGDGDHTAAPSVAPSLAPSLTAPSAAVVTAAATAAVPFLLTQRFPPWALAAAAGPLPPPARTPGVLDFNAWCDLYRRDLDRMLRYLRARVGAGDGVWAHWDWAGVRRSLAAHVYRTSANRRRSFRRIK